MIAGSAPVLICKDLTDGFDVSEYCRCVRCAVRRFRGSAVGRASRRWLGVALSAGCAVSAVAAQPALAGPKSIGGATAATACETWKRNNSELTCSGAVFDAYLAGLQAQAAQAGQQAVSQGKPNNWASVLWLFGTAQAANGCGSNPALCSVLAGKLLGQGVAMGWLGRNNSDCQPGWQHTGRPCTGGSFGGGGASGEWDESGVNPCKEYRFRLDEAGNFVLPTIPLTPGTAAYPAKTGIAGSNLWRLGTPNNFATSPQAVALWFTHKTNASKTKDKWQGVYAMRYQYDNGPSLAFESSAKSYWTGTAWSMSHTGIQNVYNYGQSAGIFPGCTDGSSSGATCKPCPDGATSGTFDIYLETGKVCILYSPNKSISPSGYFYPAEVSIPINTALALATQSKSTLACELDPDLIRRLTQELLDRADLPGIVTNEDVRTGGETPRIQELTEPPVVPTTVPPEATPPSSTPDPADPTPTPSPSSTMTSYDPGVNLGDPLAPDIDWWPDLPTIEVDLGAPTCPTYPLNVPAPFNWSLTLDAHCPLVEQNRAMIAAIMMLLWTVAAVMVILKA